MRSAARHCGVVFLLGGVDTIGLAILDGLVAAGHTVQPLLPNQKWDLGPLEVIVIYGPAQSLAPVMTQLRQAPALPPVLVWLTEQLPSPQGDVRVQRMAARLRSRLEWFGPSGGPWQRSPEGRKVLTRAGRLRIVGELLALHDMGCLTRVATFTDAGARTLQRFGLPAIVAPLGFHESMGRRLRLDRDVDVVFLGTLGDRRRRAIVPPLMRQLADRGLRVAVRDGSAEHGEVYGEDRTMLLNRAKVMLNVMRQPWDDGIYRMLLAAANGALVVSEPILPLAQGPFLPGEHFVMAPVAQLTDTITDYVAHVDARVAIAERAWGLVSEDLTMGRMVERVFEELR